MSYKEDVYIDKNKLDEAWENQALLFCQWAEKVVEATFDRDRAKENLEIVKATLDKKIRMDSARTNTKITEEAIKNSIILSQDYQEANQQVIESVKTLGIMYVAKDSFEHRKAALSKLTDLWLSQYWSEPREGQVTKKVREDQARESHYAELQKGMKKRGKV